MKLVRKELELLGTGKESPLTVEEVPVLSGTATDMEKEKEKEEGAQKTSSDVVLVEVSVHFQGFVTCFWVITNNIAVT